MESDKNKPEETPEKKEEKESLPEKTEVTEKKEDEKKEEEKKEEVKKEEEKKEEEKKEPEKKITPMPAPSPSPPKEFTISYEKRRYKQDELEKGRKFFMERYITLKMKQKEEKLKKYKSMNLNNEAVVSPMAISRESLFGTTLNGEYDNEKEHKKFNATYLQLVEKSILSFNLKKYEESYDILLKCNIINDVDEFGEFLFLQNGFDKSLIGEYLPKFKPPNYNGEVLSSFTQSFNLKTKRNFLESFRFFLSRVGVPKDANLILVLVEEFSKVYYFDNKKDYFELSPNDFYLLASTVLALNTMITRSKDIKNINMIKKEEFIKMNHTLNKQDIGNIYDELNANPIDFEQDYNEIVYKILSTVVSEKENTYDDVKRDVYAHSFYRKNNLYSLDKQINEFGEYEKQILYTGGEFNMLKNSPNDNNPRFVVVNKVFTEIQLKKSKNKTKKFSFQFIFFIINLIYF